MSIYIWEGKILFRYGQLAKGPECCCEEPISCGCDGLPDTIWAHVTRNTGDFSDCLAGEFDDEWVELTKFASNPNEWQGTSPTGYTVYAGCNSSGDVVNEITGATQTTMQIWVCDVADEANYNIECPASGTWPNPFLDMSVIYPFGFTIGLCDCGVGATIYIDLYHTLP